MRSVTHPLRLMDAFPNANAGNFTREEWLSRFSNANVIIHCQGKNVYYPTHWGPLSVKCAFSGNEYYQKQRCKYAVSDDCFLLMNEGTAYSSYIEPGHEVESLTINFNREYQSDVKRTICTPVDKLVDQPVSSSQELLYVEEKLYKYNHSVSLLIYRIRELTKDFHDNEAALQETLYFLLDALFRHNAQLVHEIKDIQAVRLSTRMEIYRRLNEVRDYIDSCFNEDITLEKLAGIALMSPFHLLRQFKKNYRVTPHQYLISRRLERARAALVNSDALLADICFMTGFRDTCSFSKLFRKKFGRSPQQYRDDIRK